MGDNRDNSADSRVPVRAGGVGMLPVDNLIGRVDGIVGSWDLGMQQPAGVDLAEGPAAVALFLGVQWKQHTAGPGFNRVFSM